jgi:hypothetical protein
VLYLQPEEVLRTVPALVGHRVLVSLLGASASAAVNANSAAAVSGSTTKKDAAASSGSSGSLSSTRGGATSGATAAASGAAASGAASAATVAERIQAAAATATAGMKSTAAGPAAAATAAVAAAEAAAAAAGAGAAAAAAKASQSRAVVRGRVLRVRPPVGSAQPLLYEVALDWGALVVCPATCVTRDLTPYWARQHGGAELGGDSGLLATAGSWWAKAKFW